MLHEIVRNIKDDTVVSFDSFGKNVFESKIKKEIIRLNNCVSIESCDSQKEKGIQFADNACSVIRHHLTNNDPNCFYEIISDKAYCID